MARGRFVAGWSALLVAAVLVVACGQATTGTDGTAAPSSSLHVSLQCQTCGGGVPTAPPTMTPAPAPIATLGGTGQGTSITIGKGGYWPITITNTGNALLFITGVRISQSGGGHDWGGQDYGASWCEPNPNTSTVRLAPGASCNDSWFYNGYDTIPTSITVTYLTNGGNVSFTWIGDPN